MLSTTLGRQLVINQASLISTGDSAKLTAFIQGGSDDSEDRKRAVAPEGPCQTTP